MNNAKIFLFLKIFPYVYMFLCVGEHLWVWMWRPIVNLFVFPKLLSTLFTKTGSRMRLSWPASKHQVCVCLPMLELWLHYACFLLLFVFLFLHGFCRSYFIPCDYLAGTYWLNHLPFPKQRFKQHKGRYVWTRKLGRAKVTIFLCAAVL